MSMMWQVIDVEKMAFLTQPSVLDVIRRLVVHLMFTNILLTFSPWRMNGDPTFYTKASYGPTPYWFNWKALASEVLSLAMWNDLSSTQWGVLTLNHVGITSLSYHGIAPV